MFKKKEISIRFKVNHSNIQFEKTIQKLGEKEAMLFLENTFHKYGPLVIQNASETEIILTTMQSRELDKKDLANYLIQEKLDDLSSKIVDTVKKEMNESQLLVYAKGKLKGIYSTQELANLKIQKLKEEGFSKEDIKVDKMKLNSF